MSGWTNPKKVSESGRTREIWKMKLARKGDQKKAVGKSVENEGETGTVSISSGERERRGCEEFSIINREFIKL